MMNTPLDFDNDWLRIGKMTSRPKSHATHGDNTVIRQEVENHG